MQNKEYMERKSSLRNISSESTTTIPRTIILFLRNVRPETGWCGLEIGANTQMAKQLIRRSTFRMILGVESRISDRIKEAKKTLLVRMKQLRYVEA